MGPGFDAGMIRCGSGVGASRAGKPIAAVVRLRQLGRPLFECVRDREILKWVAGADLRHSKLGNAQEFRRLDNLTPSCISLHTHPQGSTRQRRRLRLLPAIRACSALACRCWFALKPTKSPGSTSLYAISEVCRCRRPFDAWLRVVSQVNHAARDCRSQDAFRLGARTLLWPRLSVIACAASLEAACIRYLTASEGRGRLNVHQSSALNRGRIFGGILGVMASLFRRFFAAAGVGGGWPVCHVWLSGVLSRANCVKSVIRLRRPALCGYVCRLLFWPSLTPPDWALLGWLRLRGAGCVVLQPLGED